MNSFRNLSAPEKSVISFLLQANPETVHFVSVLNNILVKRMNDGDMGSLSLFPMGLEAATRSFGKELVMGQFFDADGTSVSMTINVDRQGNLFEIDVWKADFSSLVVWPDPSAIRIIKK